MSAYIYIAMIDIPAEIESDFNRISDILSSVYGIDTGPLVTSLPFENDRYFGRLDWNINDDHRLELTYQRLEEGTTRPDDFSTSRHLRKWPIWALRPHGIDSPGFLERMIEWIGASDWPSTSAAPSPTWFSKRAASASAPRS